MEDAVGVVERFAVAVRDDDLLEEVARVAERLRLLLFLLLAVEAKRGLDVDLVVAAIDDEVDLVLANRLLAVPVATRSARR